MRSRLRGLALATLALLVGAEPLAAAEVKLLTAGAMRGVLEALLPEFEKRPVTRSPR